MWSLRFTEDVTDLSQRVGPIRFGALQGTFDSEGGADVFWRAAYQWHFRVTAPAPQVASSANTTSSGRAAPPGALATLGGLLGVASSVDVDLRFQGEYHNGAKALMDTELDHMAEDGSRCAQLCVCTTFCTVSTLLCCLARAGIPSPDHVTAHHAVHAMLEGTSLLFACRT